MAARKREWIIIKVTASNTESSSPVVKVSVMGPLDVREWLKREVQKEKHGNFVPRAEQAVPWGILVSCPGLGEWGNCTFCTFLGNGVGRVMACCPGNLPGTSYPENLPSLSHAKCPNAGEMGTGIPKG